MVNTVWNQLSIFITVIPLNVAFCGTLIPPNIHTYKNSRAREGHICKYGAPKINSLWNNIYLTFNTLNTPWFTFAQKYFHLVPLRLQLSSKIFSKEWLQLQQNIKFEFDLDKRYVHIKYGKLQYPHKLKHLTCYSKTFTNLSLLLLFNSNYELGINCNARRE